MKIKNRLCVTQSVFWKRGLFMRTSDLEYKRNEYRLIRIVRTKQKQCAKHKKKKERENGHQYNMPKRKDF